MKGKLLLVLALPVIAYLAAKLYLHMQVGKSVDLLVSQMSPFADVSYGSVTSTFDGKIGITNIVIRPVTVNEDVKIAEISIKLPSMMYILNLEDRVQQQDLPEALSVKIHDVAVNTRGKLVEAMEDAMFSADPDARVKAFDNCVTRTNLPSQLYLLGYDEIRSTFEMGYYYDAAHRHFVLHGKAGQIDYAEFSGELAMVASHFDVFSLMAAFSDPEIARASLEITDTGYFNRVFEYCASGEQLAKDQVVALLTEDVLAMFDDLPIQPHGPLVDAYTEFVSDGSSLRITMDPTEPQKLQYLSLYDPADVPALLNVQTQVN